jgi:hypothetical protein
MNNMNGAEQSGDPAAQAESQIQLMMQHIQSKGLSVQDLTGLAHAVIEVMQDPSKYPDLVQNAIRHGLITQGEAPEEFNTNFLTMLLMALKQLVEQGEQGQQHFARGGLAQLANQGRGGDTMLAHINPQEAEVLRLMGGSGTVNPNTGLREFKGGVLGGVMDAVGPLAGVIAPIALDFFVPGAGEALAAGMGGGLMGSIGAGAVMGGAGAALGGQDPIKGAAMGALGGGAGSALGSAAGDAVGQSLSDSTANVVGSGLAGGALNALQGKSLMGGLAQGAMGGALGNSAGGLGGDMGGAIGQGVTAGGATAGNALTVGYTPQQAVAMGALSGLSKSIAKPQDLSMKPSEAVVSSYQQAPGGLGNGAYDFGTPTGTEMVTQGGMNPTPTVGQGGDLAWPSPTSTGSNPESGGSSGMSAMNVMKGLSLAGALGGMGGAQQTTQQQTNPMSIAQQEYFSRPSQQWDWGRLQADAAASGKGLNDYMAQNWDKLSSGAYNQGSTPRKFARGGALSQVAYAVGGSGSGRDDTIDAKLSDGEYVMDAETVAMLGDGSNKEGAVRLDQMRAALRAHKGKNLSRGQISPDAKSPLAYLKGAR